MRASALTLGLLLLALTQALTNNPPDGLAADLQEDLALKQRIDRLVREADEEQRKKDLAREQEIKRRTDADPTVEWVLWQPWARYSAGAPDPITLHDEPGAEWPSRAACEARIPLLRDATYDQVRKTMAGEAEVSKGPTGLGWITFGYSRSTFLRWECLPVGQVPQ